MFENIKLKHIVLIFTGVFALLGILVGIYFIRNNNADFPSEPDHFAESGVTEQDKMPECEILSITESGEWMVVETAYGSFKYPFAFSDLIVLEAANTDTTAQLQFFINIDNSKVPIYTIHYNSGEGSECGKLMLSETKKSVVVSVVFGKLPEELTEDWERTFFAAQETFNDVLFSMADDENFDIVE